MASKDVRLQLLQEATSLACLLEAWECLIPEEVWSGQHQTALHTDCTGSCSLLAHPQVKRAIVVGLSQPAGHAPGRMQVLEKLGAVVSR